MSQRAHYIPGPARGARVNKETENWTLVLERELRHAPAVVWEALTDPAQLREWAPFDADTNLGEAGNVVKLTTVGAPGPHVVETTIKRAEKPKLLEFNWGGGDMRWELDAHGSGTRLTLWANINRRFISMGATGWHVCLDVLGRYLDHDPIGRTVGPDAFKIEGWQKLHEDYAQLLGVEMPKWQPNQGG